jgi:uroporphyrinogen decarboxylase
LELLDYEQGLTAIQADAEKVKACLDRLSDGAADLGKKQAALGVDAILISSAFAGAGFISPGHYEEFVLPYEKKVITEIKKEKGIPVYTHTCGSIGDRLELMIETGTDGLDSLDPPPLGTVKLEEAKDKLEGRLFIKGNIDPVNTLLNGSPDRIKEDVKRTIDIGKPGGRYILSSACSVPPHTPPKNLEMLVLLAEDFGRYL